MTKQEARIKYEQMLPHIKAMQEIVGHNQILAVSVASDLLVSFFIGNDDQCYTVRQDIETHLFEDEFTDAQYQTFYEQEYGVS